MSLGGWTVGTIIVIVICVALAIIYRNKKDKDDKK